ncbi:outer membrane beta-barrel protein [Aliihoeflea aestuarii]|jgi:outer membrane immunogenic protein|uniref:outer membrane protein n=1 Tax=Aliihoeflea aestuarii TaxID=453840 RepID=UPI002095091E|nr:outer membrane protein [Aliihoeflea aestuarii]MCO6392749.1 outer membrane beta-barrel protein [Aliihoeflea aestuarii]
MKNFYRPAALALGVAMISAPAFAADVVYQEPPAPAAPMEIAPVNTWTGPYAGISAGYGFEGQTDLPGVGIDTDGWMGGAFGGYQVQNGSLVYGAEADINYSNLDGSVEGIDGTVTSRTTVDGSIRGRLGVTVTEDILLYGTAGLAAERQRIGVEAPGYSERDTNVALGYTVGAGVDARLTDQVFARAEYRYTDYGSETYELPGLPAFDADSNNHRVTVGLGVKF